MAKLITASEVISKAFTNANTDTALIKDSFIDIAMYNHLRPVIGEDLYNLIISEKNANVIWKWTFSSTTLADDATITSATLFGPLSKNWYVEGTGIPMFKDGYTDNENNHYTKILSVTDDSNLELNAKATAANTVDLDYYSPIGYLVEKYIKDLLAFAVKFEVLPDMTYNSTSQGIVENIADFTTPVNSKKLSFLRNEVYKQAQTYKRRMVEFLHQEDLNYPLYEPDDESTTKRSGIIMY
jgi:hypothetical protein